MKKPNDKKRPNSNMTLAHFKRSRERLVHLSAPLLDHPLWIHAAQQRALSSYTGPRWAVGPGSTLNVKRNAMKRQRRELMVNISGSERAYRHDRAMTRTLAHLAA